MSTDAATQFREFFRSGTLLRYQKGEILLHAGDTPKGVYFIEQGFIKVYSIRNTGDFNLHVIYKPGDIFPLTWAYRGTTMDVYYEAMEDDVVVSRSSREQFRALVSGNPAIAELVLRLYSEILWVYANRVENLELQRSYDRVIYRLLSLAERAGRRNDQNEIIIQAPVTHKDIADSLHMIRETASREIEKLERKNLIEQRDHQIIIKNITKLRQELAKVY